MNKDGKQYGTLMFAFVFSLSLFQDIGGVCVMAVMGLCGKVFVAGGL